MIIQCHIKCCCVFLSLISLDFFAMVKSTARKASAASQRLRSKTLKRIAGPSTIQLRESKQSIRTLSASVALLQEMQAMREEKDLVRRMQSLVIVVYMIYRL